MPFDKLVQLIQTKIYQFEAMILVFGIFINHGKYTIVQQPGSYRHLIGNLIPAIRGGRIRALNRS